jgi:hypothetical protein
MLFVLVNGNRISVPAPIVDQYTISDQRPDLGMPQRPVLFLTINASGYGPLLSRGATWWNESRPAFAGG